MFYFMGLSYVLGAFHALVSEEARKKWLEQSDQRCEYIWSSSLAGRNWYFAWLNDDTVTFLVFNSHNDGIGNLRFPQRDFLALRIARCQRTIFAILYLAIYLFFHEITVKSNLDQSAQE